jgi:fused signal recognition particle receptor
MKAALARGVDVVLIDTAGRLHTRANLMEELRKVRRIVEREVPGAPHETLLVLDATTGQNAIAQARTFADAIGLTGIVLTKLDGTARGGVAIAVRREVGVPLRYIGIGEGADDLRSFDAHQFVDALFETRDSSAADVA